MRTTPARGRALHAPGRASIAGRRVQRQHAVDAVARDRRGDPLRRLRAQVVDAEDGRAPAHRAHRLGQARAAGVEAEVADLVVDAQRVPHARRRRAAGPRRARRGARAGRRARDAELAREVAPELIVTTGILAFTARPDRRAEPRLGQRDDEAVGLRGDRLGDHRLHAVEAVDVGRPVGDEHVHLARGGLDAVAHDRPERARRAAVGDHDDPDGVAAGAGCACGGRGVGASPETTSEDSWTVVVFPHPARASDRGERRHTPRTARTARRRGDGGAGGTGTSLRTVMGAPRATVRLPGVGPGWPGAVRRGGVVGLG